MSGGRPGLPAPPPQSLSGRPRLPAAPPPPRQPRRNPVFAEEYEIADVAAVDGGSTDSGPSYLGAGVAKTAGDAVRRDLRLLLAAASSARIPLIVGSCGTSGTDSGVNWVAGIAHAICGMPPGPTWHAAKIVECGGQYTTKPAAGGVLARIDHRGFTVEPLDPDAACTPASVAAHMLYETVNPYTMREPGGTIEVAGARYTAIDERTVRVEGSRFEPADQYTVKLEGAAVSGYETMSFTGIRDPQILRSIDEWAEFFTKALTGRVETVLELASASWGADLRLYGYNAILGELETEPATPAERAVVLPGHDQRAALCRDILSPALPQR